MSRKERDRERRRTIARVVEAVRGEERRVERRYGEVRTFHRVAVVALRTVASLSCAAFHSTCSPSREGQAVVVACRSAPTRCILRSLLPFLFTFRCAIAPKVAHRNYCFFSQKHFDFSSNSRREAAVVRSTLISPRSRLRFLCYPSTVVRFLQRLCTP